MKADNISISKFLQKTGSAPAGFSVYKICCEDPNKYCPDHTALIAVLKKLIPSLTYAGMA